MKVTFGQTFDNVPPTKLNYLLGSYLQVPKMSNEQVKKANAERKLPENFYLHAFVPNSVRGNSQRTITITKGMPKLHYSQEFITTFIPKGLALENRGNRTYLKEEGTDITAQNKKILKTAGIAAVVIAGLYGIKKGIDVFI